jgi:hypothetical protein
MYRRLVAIALLAALTATVQAQNTPPSNDKARTKLLASCTRLFGRPNTLDPQHPTFHFNRNFFVLVTFSDSGHLKEISLEPNWFLLDREATEDERRHELTSREERTFLSRADSLQPMGEIVKKADWGFFSGPGTTSVDEFQHAKVKRFWRGLTEKQGTLGHKDALQQIVVTYK